MVPGDGGTKPCEIRVIDGIDVLKMVASNLTISGPPGFFAVDRAQVPESRLPRSILEAENY